MQAKIYGDYGVPARTGLCGSPGTGSTPVSRPLKIMERKDIVLAIVFTMLMLPISGALYFTWTKNQDTDKRLFGYSSASLAGPSLSQIKAQINIAQILPQKLQNPPEIIKAVYLTSWSSASKKYIDGYLSDLVKNTEINAVVIDIKDYSGYVSYLSKSPEVLKYKTSKEIISDLPELIKKLHEKNIYTIARISTFQDPAFARARPDLAVYDKVKTTDLKNPVLWQDGNGLNWLSPASTEAQDYNISIARDALANGFDEINFDYIRFPSDGKTKNMEIPFYDGKTARHIVIKDFFAKIRKELPDAVISADLFGQVTVNYDDLGIGQIMEDSFEYFDYICPMIYPSHYAPTFMGYKNPALYPYDVVKYSLDIANTRETDYADFILKPGGQVKKLAKIRPWLQDFNMGAVYTTAMVKEQITATKEALGANYAGYLMWNPSNVYKQDALQKEVTEETEIKK